MFYSETAMSPAKSKAFYMLVVHIAISLVWPAFLIGNSKAQSIRDQILTEQEQAENEYTSKVTKRVQMLKYAKECFSMNPPSNHVLSGDLIFCSLGEPYEGNFAWYGDGSILPQKIQYKEGYEARDLSFTITPIENGFKGSFFFVLWDYGTISNEWHFFDENYLRFDFECYSGSKCYYMKYNRNGQVSEKGELGITGYTRTQIVKDAENAARREK